MAAGKKSGLRRYRDAKPNPHPPVVREAPAVYRALARPVLVDSNVLIDIVENDPVWYEWSAAALERLGTRSKLVINPVIYAEIAGGYATIEDLDAALAPFGFLREALPWEAGFLAAQAHKLYRKRGGARKSTLPDFYIGAHASLAAYTLLTRDAARYREYFPQLVITAPGNSN